jgi:hypothetical protein
MSMWIDADELRVGDTIAVWWQPGRDTVVSLSPYRGRLKCLGVGARIAFFALLRSGMTIAETDRFEVLSRGTEAGKGEG